MDARLTGAIVSLIITGIACSSCGTPAPPASVPTERSSVAPAFVSRPTHLSNKTTHCKPWVRADLKLASAARLPVPTKEIAGISGAAFATRRTLPVFLGEPPHTSVANILHGWRFSGSAGKRGAVQATVAPSPYGTSVDISERAQTSAQAALLLGGFPSAPIGQPVSFLLPLALHTASDSLQSALQSLVHTVENGHSIAVDDLFVSAARPPNAYVTYAGPTHHLYYTGARCQIARGDAPFLTHGRLIETPYWSLGSANGISMGFAAGFVVVTNEHAGIIADYWYQEPRIKVPPL